MMEDCQPDMPVSGSAFSIVDQIPGADAFLSQCHDVLDSSAPKPPAPLAGSWHRVNGQFLAVDQGCCTVLTPGVTEQPSGACGARTRA